MTEVEYESEELIQYQNGEIVWAKITGFPWWPALIKKVPDEHNPKFCVDFIADNTHAFVGINKIAKYEELRDDVNMSKHMIKGLRKAIFEADQVVARRREQADQTHVPPLEPNSEPPTQKQLSQSPFIKQTILQENLPQQSYSLDIIPLPEQHRITQQIRQPTHPQNQQAEDVLALGSKLKREEHVNSLLKKYKLVNIPSVSAKVIMRKEPKEVKVVKKKKIFKVVKHKKSQLYKYGKVDEEQIQAMLCRKIYLFLRNKKQISTKERREISLNLSKQVFYQFFKMESSMEDVLRVFKWLNLGNPNNIADYYNIQSAFSLEKEKSSNVTTIE